MTVHRADSGPEGSKHCTLHPALRRNGKAAAKGLDFSDRFRYQAPQFLGQGDRIPAVGGDVIDGAFCDMCLKHFLQTHGLCAQLDLILLLRTELSVLIFHRVQPNRKIQRRDAAAANIRLRFDAIALSCNAQGVGIDQGNSYSLAESPLRSIRWVWTRSCSERPLAVSALSDHTCSLVSSAARRRQKPAWDSRERGIGSQSSMAEPVLAGGEFVPGHRLEGAGLETDLYALGHLVQRDHRVIIPIAPGVGDRRLLCDLDQVEELMGRGAANLAWRAAGPDRNLCPRA